MAWLFFGLVASFLGLSVEGKTRQTPALRPGSAASGAWYLLAKITGILLLIAFVYAFFVLPWWAVFAVWAAAFITQLFFWSSVLRAAAAPGISMLLMVVGVALIAFGITRPAAGIF